MTAPEIWMKRVYARGGDLVRLSTSDNEVMVGLVVNGRSMAVGFEPGGIRDLIEGLEEAMSRATPVAG